MAARGASVGSNAPLVVIVGPTASGKTGVAIKLAERFNGEIICADSRTIYRGMDIGTAKPTAEERVRVPHWGLDLVEPGERFTAADFKAYATRKIDEIRARGHVPFLVGGTGLYIDGVVFNFDFSTDTASSKRSMLEKLTIEGLQKYCVSNNIALPENYKNKRYLIRAIERARFQSKKQESPIENTIIVGITTDKEALYQRIEQRTEQLFNDGVVEEAIRLGEKYGLESEAFTGNIYRVVKSYLAGEIGKQDMKDRVKILDRQLAKRQRTWFKRNPFIQWLTLEEVEQYVATCLAK